jgi:glycosyltransferase involved in cell wall biosynthesis
MGADTLSSFAVKNLRDVVHCASMHGSYEGYPSVIKKKKRTKVFSRTDGIIYVTPRNIDFLKYVEKKNNKLKITQIYYGCNPSMFDTSSNISRKELQIPESAFVFIQVARGTKDKGWKETIDAYNIIKARTKIPVRLLLVGDGDFLRELKKLYSNEPGILFYGYAGNPAPLVKISDAGLLPTFYKGESLPFTVIEYLFNGKPVIASDIGEIKNMIGSNTEFPAGFVLNLTSDGPVNEKELAEKMLIYIQQKYIYNSHVSNTSKQFEKFKMDNCISSYTNFFSELLNEKMGA